jgi:hypothetical protein
MITPAYIYVLSCSYVTRTGLQYRFWSQAVQTSVQKQFFSFRCSPTIRPIN